MSSRAKKRYVMKCYYHEAKEAVGLCQKCGKALCKDCISLNEKIIICNSDCLGKKIIDDKIECKNNFALEQTDFSNSFQFIFIVLGTFLLICGSGIVVFSLISYNFVEWFIGAVLTVLGIASFGVVRGMTIEEKSPQIMAKE